MNFPRSRLATTLQKARIIMDVILHLGAHRTASTSFQHYMRENKEKLGRAGIGFWGPRRTRSGLLTGVLPCSSPISAAEQLDRATGRIALNLHRARAQKIKQMVVSDENMIGAPRRNLRSFRLYGNVGARMARYSQAFGGKINRIVLSIRSQDSYWSSVIAFAVARGHWVPSQDDLDRLVTTNRHWRDVIMDLACAVPDAEIQIQPYETFGGRPERKLAYMTGWENTPRTHAREWKNRAADLPQLRHMQADRMGDTSALPVGEGRWNPFDRSQTLALREAYADDLFWLRAGADGLATLAEEIGSVKAVQKPAAGLTKRGQTDGITERRMA